MVHREQPPVYVQGPLRRPHWRVLKGTHGKRGVRRGSIAWWVRRFVDPEDLVRLKGGLLVCLFLASGFLGS